MGLWPRLGLVAAVTAMLAAGCWLGIEAVGDGQVTAIAVASITATAALTLGTVWASRARERDDDGAEVASTPVPEPQPTRAILTGPEGRPAVGYMGTILQIASTTSNFEGREDWLRRLAAFAHGSDGYLLIEGVRYAGKTALLARFVTEHVPKDVEDVAYFASRLMSSADAPSFLSEVIPQLAVLAGTDIPADTQRVTAFWSLWDLAADAVARRRHHLLLVVDGLDEDLKALGRSIAAILPTNVAGRAGGAFAHAHVLVSNREGRPLPPDILAGHPLAQSAAENLTRYARNENYESLARQEIADLLLVPDAQSFLGVLAAAGGALSEADLVRLTALTAERVREFLTRAQRSLPPLGDGRYAFDPEFLQQVQGIPDLQISQHRAAIHAWADEWRQRGWQDEHADVPRYMLDVYPETLGHDPARRAGLVGDPRWIAAAIRRLHVDTVLAKLASWVRASPAEIAPMLAIVRGQATFLRSAANLDAGEILRQLCLQATELEEDELATAFLAALSDVRGLMPLWSSRRPYRALIAEINGRAGWVNAVALLPSGQVVAGADDGRVWLWDPSIPSAEVRTIGRHDRPVRALAVLEDGRVISGGDDRRVRIWDPSLASGEPIELGRHDGAVRAVAILDSDRVVSGGDDWWVRVWSIGGHPERTGKLGQHAGNIRGLAVDRHGHVVSAGDDGRLMLWDPRAPGTPVARAEAPGVRIMTVAVGPDLSVFAGGNDWVVYRWYHRFCDGLPEGDSDLPYEQLDEFGSHGNVVRGVAVTQDGLTISGSDDSRLRLWQATPHGTERIELGRHDGAVRTVSARDGRAVSGGGRDQKVRFWDLREPQLAVRERIGPAERMFAVSLCPDGWTISGGISKRLWLWDPERHEPTVIGKTDAPALAICSLRGSTFVTADANGVIQLWDRSVPGKALTDWPVGQHPGALLCLAGDYLITAGYDGRVLRWDLAAVLSGDGQASRGGTVLGRHSSPVVAITPLPGGRVATGATGGDVIVWQPGHSGAMDHPLEPMGGRLNALCFLPEFLVAGGDDGRLHVWDLLSGPARTSLPAHDGAWLTSLSVCGRYLISAGTDGRLVTWDRQPGGLRVHSEVATRVTALSGCSLADGARLAAAHSDGGLSYWSLSPADRC
jgi:WD40 repeat protein